MEQAKPAAEAADQNLFLAEAIFQHVLGGAGDSVDIRKMARIVAGWESTYYYLKHMAGAQLFNAPKPLYDYALSLRKIAGLTLEFGVASGRTIAQIAGATRGSV